MPSFLIRNKPEDRDSMYPLNRSISAVNRFFPSSGCHLRIDNKVYTSPRKEVAFLMEKQIMQSILVMSSTSDSPQGGVMCLIRVGLKKI
jgi:hypothetical protein